MCIPPRRSIATGLFLLFLLATSTVRAAPATDWSGAFEPNAVAVNLPAGKTDFIVVGAGPATPERRDAAAALEKSVRASGRAALVMNASGLGPVEALDDATIVGKCKALPITSVVI